MANSPDLMTEIFSQVSRYVPDGAPRFNPGAFTNENNCYGYALNIKEHGWATPGRLLEIEHEEMPNASRTAPFVTKGVLKDGLEQIREHGARRDEHVISGHVIPGEDFHFYRYDNDGQWSSKYASKIAEKANPAFETDETFIGFFRVPAEGLLYSPRLKVINTLRGMGLI